jgi:hypothetical protein
MAHGFFRAFSHLPASLSNREISFNHTTRNFCDVNSQIKGQRFERTARSAREFPLARGQYPAVAQFDGPITLQTGGRLILVCKKWPTLKVPFTKDVIFDPRSGKCKK